LASPNSNKPRHRRHKTQSAAGYKRFDVAVQAKQLFLRKREGQKNVGNDLKLFQQNVEANGRRISENCLGEILQKQSATNLRGPSKVRFTHGFKIKKTISISI